MRSSDILEAFCLMMIFLVLLTLAGGDVAAQTSEPALISAPEFVLSNEAVAAGIDGTIKANLTIDETGNVTRVRLLGEPIWPCGASPKREVEAVLRAVGEHLRSPKFAPAMKDGKPHKTDVTLDFALGDAFRRAVAVEKAQKGPSPRLVKAGIVNGRAIRLAKPSGALDKGIALVQILVDEQGNVIKAGLSMGKSSLAESSREAACASKFSPTLIDGKPVRVTGVISYQYR